MKATNSKWNPGVFVATCFRGLLVVVVAGLGAGCDSKDGEGGGDGGGSSARGSGESHARMVATLAKIAATDRSENPYYGQMPVRRMQQALANARSANAPPQHQAGILAKLGQAHLDYGNIDEAIAHLNQAYALFGQLPRAGPALGELAFALGVAHLRWAETENCCANHTPSSCIVPLQGEAIHTWRQGSETAIRYFQEVIATEGVPVTTKRKGTWLMNLAYMTLGDYPDKVPPAYRVPPSAFTSKIPFPRFPNIATKLGLDTDSLSGGVVIDDFDGDQDFDIVVSSWDASVPMWYFENAGADGFRDRSKEAGFSGILGGLNLIPADYDNDGDLDIYVPRGAWLWEMGKRPDSLLQNQGDGTFRDVTYSSGMGRENHPSQTAAWADYDNDGDLDLFVGNEHSKGNLQLAGGILGTSSGLVAPSQLFRNNGDGTFTDVAKAAGVTNERFTKGCAWGDLDGDRWPDLVVSNLNGANRLYRNQGDGTFTDIAQKAGIQDPSASFPVWIWDFDNDGILDVFISSFRGSTDSYMMYALGQKYPTPSGHYRGNGDGTFTNLAVAQGLDMPMLTMGANFGDINNDGYLDFYLGTGQPDIAILVPNQMFVNDGGKRFHDVTMAIGLGHLQKGHAIAFADIDQDGDVDIFEQMGGAKRVDHYRDALYENPGFGKNWIKIKLVGVKSNRSAIGARIHATIVEDGVERSVYRHVNSGASFGGNPLQQHLGLGSASEIAKLEIYWPTTGETQSFEKVGVNQAIRITEGKSEMERLSQRRSGPPEGG